MFNFMGVVRTVKGLDYIKGRIKFIKDGRFFQGEAENAKKFKKSLKENTIVENTNQKCG